MDRTFEALANGHRRAIVDRLLAGPVETPELGIGFDMSKQALHQHLSVLERAGLIERRAVGRVHRIHLRPEPLDAVTDWATTVRRAWSDSLDRLADVLDGDERRSNP